MEMDKPGTTGFFTNVGQIRLDQSAFGYDEFERAGSNSLFRVHKDIDFYLQCWIDFYGGPTACLLFTCGGPFHLDSVPGCLPVGGENCFAIS